MSKILKNMKLDIIRLILGYFLIISFSPISSNASVIVFEEIVCEIKINKKNKTMFFLDVADTSEKRNYGLMNRESITSNSGMLFIWKNLQKRTFWMKNTNFDLDLFFLDKEGHVIEIYKKAKAYSEDIIYSKIKAMFVLELKASQHQIKKGDKLNCGYLKM
tara:strand:+ start:6970 stop:7452 length:483 start_codon:yes stop_codon:yes gene_type:complete